MCIIGNQKAQEAKNEVIQNHKQFTMTCPSRSRLCIFTTKHPFLCNEDLQLCIMLLRRTCHGKLLVILNDFVFCFLCFLVSYYAHVNF